MKNRIKVQKNTKAQPTMEHRRVGLIIGCTLLLSWMGYMIFLSLTALDKSLIATFIESVVSDFFVLGPKSSGSPTYAFNGTFFLVLILEIVSLSTV